MIVTIRFGNANEIQKDAPRGTTVGSILNDRSIQSVLGFGTNVQGVVDGEVQEATSPLGDGDVLTIETKANSKA